jgi:hypothetical protein
MKILEYCVNSQLNLRNYEQNGLSWEKRFYKEPYSEIENLNFLFLNNSAPKEIKRAHVLQAFEENDLFKGYFLTLLWGGISTQPAKGFANDKKTSSAYKAFNVDRATVIETLTLVKTELKKNNYEKAYMILKDSNKFPGVNVSFFTKFLFFISEITQSKFKLLIYDKWTKIIHLKILIENEEYQKINNYFGENYLKNFFGKDLNQINLVYCPSQFETEAYLDYCDKMNKLAIDLSEVLGKEISSGELEAFVFGMPMRGKKNKTIENPRFWILSTINKK